MPNPKKKQPIAAAGLPDDPPIFKLLTEIDLIAHFVSNEFQTLLPKTLTEAQFGILNHLLRLESEETITELANAFQVTQPTMSSTVKRLVQNGFGEFVADENDARIKRVRVTKAGRRIRNDTIAALKPHFESFEADCPAIDWQKIIPALTQLRDYLDQRRREV